MLRLLHVNFAKAQKQMSPSIPTNAKRITVSTVLKLSLDEPFTELSFWHYESNEELNIWLTREEAQTLLTDLTTNLNKS